MRTRSTEPLGSLVRIVGGGTPSKSRPEFYEGMIPWVTPKDMKVWTILDSEDHISEEAVAASPAKLVSEGTVLVVVRSGVLKHTLPVAIAGRPVTMNQDMKGLLCGENLDPRFLAFFLKSAEPRLLRTVRGTTADNIPLDELKALEVPRFPLVEQRRIADILDKADAIRCKRKEAIALTEELLRSAFLEMFGDPVTNPKGWPVKPLGELVEFCGGGTPSRTRAEFFSGSIPWATAKDFRAEFMTDTEEHVSEEAIASSATQMVPPGTILVVVKSKILMRRLPVSLATVALCFNQDVKGLLVKDLAEVPYIAAHLRMAERKLLELARGVNTEGLTLNHLRGHAVMRPPAEEIRQFVALEAKLRRSSEEYVRASQHAEQLFQALVARAFSGGLELDR